ncbi:zf-CCHC domain-containing protein [Tanacetum coccineum]
MTNTQTPFHPDKSSLITYLQHPQPNNNFVPQPSFNVNYMQQPMQNPKDISDPTTAIDMALVLMAKEFTLSNTTPINNNQRSSSNPSNMQIAQPGMNIDQDRQMLMVEDNVGNQFRPNAVQNVRNHVVHNAVQNLARAEANGNGINGNQIRCYNCQGMDHYTSNCTVKPRKWDAVYLQKQMQIAQKEEAWIQLTSEEFYFMAVVYPIS